MGPYCADVFNPRGWALESEVITLEVMRVVLAVGLFSFGVESPGLHMMEYVRGLLVLVGPTTAIGWFIVTNVRIPPSLWTSNCMRLFRIHVTAFSLTRLYILLDNIHLSYSN